MIRRYGIHIDVNLKREIFRKILHLVLALLMAVPLIPYYNQIFTDIGFSYNATLLTYALITFACAFVNSLQIRAPSIYTVSLKMLKDFRKKVVEYISSMGVENVSDILRSIDSAFDRHEERFTEFIASVEREYERRYGYIGITFTSTSITLSYVLFGSLPTLYGILALAVVDSTTAIATLLTEKKCRKILKHTIISILIAFAIYTTICFLVNNNIAVSLAIASTAIITELLSPEDNLTIPIITALLASLLHP